jgi:hypothetical protein
MGEGSEFPVTIPHNKGKSIIDNLEMAECYFTPLKLFLEHEMSQFNLTDEGKIATRAEKTKQRAFLKDHFKQLPKDVMDVYVIHESAGKACFPRLCKGSDYRHVE